MKVLRHQNNVQYVKPQKAKFEEMKEEMTWACEHVVGVAKDAPEDILKDLRMNFGRRVHRSR